MVPAADSVSPVSRLIARACAQRSALLRGLTEQLIETVITFRVVQRSVNQAEKVFPITIELRTENYDREKSDGADVTAAGSCDTSILFYCSHFLYGQHYCD